MFAKAPGMVQRSVTPLGSARKIANDIERERNARPRAFDVESFALERVGACEVVVVRTDLVAELARRQTDREEAQRVRALSPGRATSPSNAYTASKSASP